MQPRVSEVALVTRSGMGKEQEVRDDKGGGSHADCNVERVQTHKQSAKVVVSYEVGEACCSKDREVAISDFVSARGAEDEVTSGKVHSDWEKVSNDGPIAQGFRILGRVMELDVVRRPNKEGQASAALKDLLEVGRPTSESLKGPTLVGRPTAEVLNGAKACGGLHDTDCGKPDEDVFGIQMGSSPLAPNLTEITDEALMEEASRYTNHPCSLFSLGKQDFSSSSNFSGQEGVIIITDGESERGCGSEAVSGADLGPIRVILADGRETEVFGLSGKANGVVEEVIEDVSEKAFQEVVEERDDVGESCWYSSCLAKFSRCLGMPTKSFKWEILFLLKRMKERKL